MNLSKILRAAETLITAGRVATSVHRGNGSEESPHDTSAEAVEEPLAGHLEPPRGSLFGQLEARLFGTLFAALKEAFDRDRAYLDMERARIEQERQRAEELARLEWMRQVGEREVAHIRSIVTLTLGIWVTSVVFEVLRGPSVGPVGLALLALGWMLLLAALASALVLYRHIAEWLERGGREPLGPTDLPRHTLAPAIPWLVVLGLACTAASLIVSLAKP